MYQNIKRIFPVLPLTLASAMLLTLSAPAQAFRLVFGEDLSRLDSGGTIPLTVTPAASAAEALFLADLSDEVGTEDFEGLMPGTASPLTLDFGDAGMATLNGRGAVNTAVPGTAPNGRYPVSGENYWEAVAGSESVDDFSIAFERDIAALGFFGVDIGDFGGQLSLIVNLANGGTQVVEVPHTIGLPTISTSGREVPDQEVEGSVLYFGLIAENPNEVFTDVVFNMIDPDTGSGVVETFAFDNMTIATLSQVEEFSDPVSTPEPASLFGLLTVGGLVMRQLFQRRKED